MVNWGIGITTFNREDVWERSVKSLSKSRFLDNTKIHLIDDNSHTDTNIELAKKYLGDYELTTFKNPITIGSEENYRQLINSFKDTDVDVIVNLDSDGIYSPMWHEKLDSLMSQYEYNVIASVFFVRVHADQSHDPCIDLGDHYERIGLNGLGLAFPSYLISEFSNPQYPRHMDTYITFELGPKYGLKRVCTKESYIDHIGFHGVHSRPNYLDVATDFVGEE